MARITIEDCTQVVPNRFELIHLAVKRARQLSMNGYEDAHSEVDGHPDKPTVMALREIASGFTHFENLKPEAAAELEALLKQEDDQPSRDFPEGHWQEGD